MSTQTNRPNIIFCVSGQQRLDTCGCYGQSLPVTPVLDELAAQGVKFNNAFNTVPALAATRAAFMTGRTPNETKVFCKHQQLPQGVKTIAQSLSETGYETAFVGNWGLASAGDADKDDPAVNNTDKPVPAELRGGFNGFWRASDDLNATSTLFKGHVFDENNNKVEFDGWRSDKLTDFALEFLDKHDKTKPFFMTVEFGEPCISMVDREEIEKEKSKEMTEEEKKAAEAEKREAEKKGENVDDSPLVKTVISPDEKTKYQFVNCSVPIPIQVYAGSFRSDYMNHLAQCNNIDTNIGRLIEKLKAAGEWDNTVLVVTAATGNHFGGRNLDLRFNGLDDYASSVHAESSQVPLVIAGGAIKDNKVVDHLVSTVSVTKTMLTLAGVECADLYGDDLLSLDTEEVSEDETLFYYITQSRVGRAIRTKQYIYCVSADDLSGIKEYKADKYRDDCMYDIKNDEYEVNNLIRDICYGEIKKNMRDRLIETIEKQEGMKVTVENYVSHEYKEVGEAVPTVQLF